MKIKKIMMLIMFTIFGYGCVNSSSTGNGGGDNTEYLDVFFTYYKQGEDPNTEVDLKVPKGTQTFLTSGPIIINFKNENDATKYKVILINSSGNKDAAFPNYLLDKEGDNLIEIISKQTGLIVQDFKITYASAQ